MRTVPLTPNIQDRPHAVERTAGAAIVGEIAAHLVDMAEVAGRTRTEQFLAKLHLIWKEEPPALWVLLRVMSGDLAEVTRSYSQQGRADTRSKQACQQELERVLEVLDLHYPDAAAALVELRGITAKWKGGA